MIAALPSNELERLHALRECNVLDTAPQEEFDDITRLAAQVCGTPISTVSLIDEERQWFKSVLGLDVRETARDDAFCAHTILQSELMIVPDAQADARFADNPHVTGDPGIRFYAGAPLITEDGHALGSLCVIDRTPRVLTPEQKATLSLLARQVCSHLRAARRVSERERVDAALARAHSALRAVLDSAPIILYTADADGTVTLSEGTGLTALGLSPSEAVGRSVFEFSAGNADNEANTRRALAGEAVSYDARVGGTWLHTEMRPLQGADGAPAGIIGVCLDVTARMRAEEGIADHTIVLAFQKAQQEELRGSGERLCAALTASGTGTFRWDLRANALEWDENLDRLFGLPLGRTARTSENFFSMIHPDDRVEVVARCRRCAAEGADFDMAFRVLWPDGSVHWLDDKGKTFLDAEGRPTYMTGACMDISARKADEEQLRRRAERDRFLAELAERARVLIDPDEVIADAVCSVGRFLGVDRCVFVDIDIAADTCTAFPDYRADESVVSIAGVFPLSMFGDALVTAYGAGRPVIVDDVRLDRDQVPEGSVAAYDAIGISAHVGVPVLHSSRLVSCIGVHSATPRHWEPEEVGLLRTVVERTWLTVEITRQHRALALAAEEQRARAEREALLNRIGQALLAATDSAVTEGRAVTLLGEALGADRCYLVSWDHARDRALIFQDHRRADLPSLTGEYGASNYASAMDALFAHGTAVISDARSPGLDHAVAVVMGGGGLRAVLAVPFFDRKRHLTTALWVAMTDGPRPWTPEEVSLVETVAAMTHTAVEAARVAERERNIARQLQTALTPAVPECVPGMVLAKYYEAALDEAGVGGDFYDVFQERAGRTVLAVGDLSGKGLAAATQVATVRNMLRYALFRARTLAGALTSLNALLTEQHLLTGFATLFVGAFDSGDGTLTYVNCGQEAALVRRSGTGLVELLPPTGPVLGSFEGVAFEERTVMLGRGDALAVFTDGLTEVGRSRMQMLGVEGVAGLLGRAAVPAGMDDAEVLVEHLSQRLIEGVDAAAQGGVMRDDVCLLVGVVE